MFNCRILAAGYTAAMPTVLLLLKQRGFILDSQPSDQITHLLLPVPAFDSDGNIRGGGSLTQLLEQMDPGIAVIGGNLTHPLLKNYQKMDLLQDPQFVSQNAAITAHCTLRMVLQRLPCTAQRCPMLLIGWGRIGKCLAQLLRAVGAKVVVAARKAQDRAMLEALGYNTMDTAALDPTGFRVIINTAPELILEDCGTNALKIDLASKPGITGPDVIWARGLPGKDAPESAGHLIADTVTGMLMDQEVCL